MEILSAIIDFFCVLDSKNILNKKWNVIIDSNEYIGTRFIAFVTVLILIVLYLALLAGIIFLFYAYIYRKKSNYFSYL